MSMKLYVGNLSFRTTEDELHELFSQAGTVESASIVTDRETGRSRGFGFIEMANEEEGTNAITQFNGRELDGRALTVNEARPKVERSGGGFNRGGGGGGFNRDRGGRGGRSGGGGGHSSGGGGREPRW